ncbi:hypothetical protein GCM10008910_22280 [Faecalicatena orotica]|uniref:Uncharacterized protein n=1 Tax=Faecalicatena orotica TaxID=1544 RepID=A0A2Y9B9W8_9FIRM|nr:hypothetical protein A8806_101748 [Faecalicatena orotica]SSA54292.1 hypothetical protein SAMN05216536_101748 [Faecalicatena orotica]
MSRQRQSLRKPRRKTVTVKQAALQFTDFSVSLSAACRVSGYAVLSGIRAESSFVYSSVSRCIARVQAI